MVGQVGYRRTIQRVLDRLAWGADAVPDALREQMIEVLIDAEDVLAVDEIGVLKRGARS